MSVCVGFVVVVPVCEPLPPQIMVTEEVEREKRVLAGEEQRRVISLQVESSILCLKELLD